MILDSSALVAIARAEPEARAFLTLMRQADVCRIGAPTLLETSMVLSPLPPDRADALVAATGLEVVPFGHLHLGHARGAFQAYGKGQGHPAQLNFGDCMSYALAKVSGEPLLFKGEDFTHTDITPAWLPGVS